MKTRAFDEAKTLARKWKADAGGRRATGTGGAVPRAVDEKPYDPAEADLDPEVLESAMNALRNPDGSLKSKKEIREAGEAACEELKRFWRDNPF